MDIGKAVEILEAGGVLCIPTESSYGLAADIASRAGLDRLGRIKTRAASSPYGLIAADRAQARALVSSWPDAAEELADRFWPGPLTLVLPAQPDLPAEIVGPGGGVGIRVSDHPVPTALARRLGRPITATSANPNGRPAAYSIAAARQYFGERVCYWDEGPLPPRPPSTVVAIAADGRMSVLRPGPIAIEFDGRPGP